MKFISALLSLEIIGAFFLLIVIRRDRYKFSLTEFLSLSFLLGASCSVFQLFLYDLAGIDFSFQNVVIMPVFLLILILARYASRPERSRDFLPIDSVDLKFSKIEKWLLLGIIIQLCWTIFLVLPIPVHSHDAVANYALKAKIFYTYNGIPSGFFGLSEATVAHPDYPLFLPLLMRWIYSFTGPNDLIINMIMPVIYLTFLGLFYSQIKRIANRMYALLTVFLLATIPQVYDYATIVHADLLLTAFITCATGYFLLYVRTGNRIQLDICALLLGSSLWIKNEAIVFTGALITVFCILVLRAGRSHKKRKFVDLTILLTIIAVIAIPWFITKFHYASANSDMNIGDLTPERIWQNIRDIPILLNLFQQEVFGPKKWNIFWVLFFFVIIWKRKILWKDDLFHITLFLMLAVAGYFAGYMATTGNNLFFYVNTTISRFMLHFTGVCMMLMMLLCGGDAFKKV